MESNRLIIKANTISFFWIIYEAKSTYEILIYLEGGKQKWKNSNKLLEPYGLSVSSGTVGEKNVDRDSLDGAQLLEGIESLDLGTVYLFASARIATTSEAEAVLQHRDAILGAKRSLGTGRAYLFSCLPAFGNKQLDRIDNRRFLGNLLKSLATPAMTTTIEALAKDEAMAAKPVVRDKALTKEKLMGSICTGKSRDLFFYSNKVIVAKKGSIAKFFGWGLLGAIADDIHKQSKAKKLSELAPDKILSANKRNFAISYDEIRRIDI